jgi:serine/threonine protein kinase
VSERWNRVSRVLDEVFEHPPAERAALLDRLCADDPAVRAEVQALLAADQEATGFLETPAEAMTLVDELADERLAAPERVGDWRVVRPIGRGGMGEVYEVARADGHFEQRAALKLIRGERWSAEMAGRFRQERQILARLEHAGIARLLDGGVSDDGRPYLVVEYVESRPLDRYADEQRMTVEERLRLFLQVCLPVAYAHRNLIVHRDLKPSNVLMTASGEVKLVDFGLAKLLGADAGDQELTRTLMVAMTPQYAAPEQVRGDPVTTATDVHALGVMLCELLTGGRPYQVTSAAPAALVRAIVEADPMLPSAIAVEPDVAARRRSTPAKLRQRLSGDLDAIVMMAVRKEPERRYSSVEALAQDVERVLDGRPVRARRGTTRYRARRFVRRHRVAVASAAVVLVLLAGFIGVLVAQARRLARERDRAERQRQRAEAVTGFLSGLFQNADPRQAQGRVVTAREILEEGTARLQAELQSDPELRGDLLHQVGRIHLSLGAYDDGLKLLREALDLRRRTLGRDNLDVAETVNAIGAALAMKGDLAAAEPPFREALAIRRRRLPADDPAIMRSLANLANAIAGQGRLAPAEPLLREFLALALKHGTETDVGAAKKGLGYLMWRLGEYESAEALMREAVDISSRQLGEDNPDHVRDLNALGALLADRGRLGEAEAVLRRALQQYRRVLGARHPDLIDTLGDLGDVLHKAGRQTESEACYREALTIYRGLGYPDPDMAPMLSGYGQLLADTGRAAEAERLLREAVMILRRPGTSPLALAVGESVLAGLPRPHGKPLRGRAAAPAKPRSPSDTRASAP